MIRILLVLLQMALTAGLLIALLRLRKKRLVFGLLLPQFLLSWACLFMAMVSVGVYPTRQSPPEDFQLHWFVVDEPGEIYLWMSGKPPNGSRPFISGKPSQTPRTYALPFEATLYASLKSKRMELAEGKAVSLKEMVRQTE